MFNEHDCGCKAEIVIVVDLRMSKQKKNSKATTRQKIFLLEKQRFTFPPFSFFICIVFEAHFLQYFFLFFRFILDISN